MSTVENVAASDPAAPAAADPRLGKAMADLNSILVPGERIEATAVQRRLFALTHRRMIMAATTGRLIAMARAGSSAGSSSRTSAGRT